MMIFFHSDSLITEVIKKCNFKERLKNCDLSKISINSNNGAQSTWNMIDWREALVFSYLTFLLYVNPTFAFICITN